MRYFSCLSESFYYAYLNGPDPFANCTVDNPSLTECVTTVDELGVVDLSHYGIEIPPLEGPGSLGPLGLSDGKRHHALVRGGSNQHPARNIVRHQWTSRMPARSFALVGPGIYVSVPEFTFLQLASRLGFERLVQVGCSLCSSYMISPGTNCIIQRPPLTSPERLSRYLDEARGVRGISAARRALRFIGAGAESPQETNLYLLLRLDKTNGGCGIPGLRFNYEIPVRSGQEALVDRPTRQSFRIDVGIPDEHVGLEYLGKFHDMQVDADRERLNALTAMGERVLQVKFTDLVDPVQADRLCRQFSQLIGAEPARLGPSEQVVRAALLDSLFGAGRLIL